MAPHPDPYPMPLAEAMALPHSGRYRACDDSDSGDDDNDWSSRWAAYCSSISAAADGSIPTATGGFPAGSTFISAADSSGGGGGLGSVKPVVIIVPVLVGVALLILAIGGCVIWRKKRRDAAAPAGDAASVSSSAGLRGGALAMGEKYNPNDPAEIPPRYEDSSRDRTISVVTSSAELYHNPFADPEPEYSPPISPVSTAAAAERHIVADGGSPVVAERRIVDENGSRSAAV